MKGQCEIEKSVGLLHAGGSSPADRSIRLHLSLGLVIVVLLIGGIGGWALVADIAGAVVAHGTVVVEGNVKCVQHRDGGIVGEIPARDGLRVKAGDLLIRLDDTVIRTGLAIVEKQIVQLTARRLRLIAERDEALETGLAVWCNDQCYDSETAELILNEEALFKSRRYAMASQKKQLGERMRQIGNEIEGLKALHEAKEMELVLRKRELVGAETLHNQGYINFPEYAELQRLTVQTEGEKGRLKAEIARSATRIAETKLQALQLEQDWQTSILVEIQDLNGKLAGLVEQRVAALDQLIRIDIRAPQSGVVHELGVHTVGGVIGAGETIMKIVPDQDNLVIEARLQPTDINEVRLGQEVVLRFSALNHRTTPEIIGYILIIAADLSRNTSTGEAWYNATISIGSDQMERLGDLPLLPGMPVEVFIQTGRRTVFTYLLKPITDQIARAMRED